MAPFEPKRVALIDRNNQEIENSKNHFRIKPEGIYLKQKTMKFIYCDEAKGKPEDGIYLASNVLATDKSAKDVYSSFEKILQELKKQKSTNIDITRGIAPISGEYGRFGVNSIGRGKPKLSIEKAALSLITTTTEKKPCLSFKVFAKGKIETENITIIPDLCINEMIDFINLFERIRSESTKLLMIGYVSEKDNKPLRPKIFDGNFPHAPRSSSLGAISLLGTIGSWSKSAEDIEWATKVLESLKEKSIYMIGTKTFEVFKYNHFVIELAKENKLSSIVDSIYYSVLYNQGKRNLDNRIEYQKFDLFTSRFFQLFNKVTFKDFLAFRAEYPNEFELLLNKYFINMEKITPEVVNSARELGKWLNYVAFKIADQIIEENTQDRYNKIREQKAKSLIEIESSVYSARSGDSLIFQAITRAGRASGLDAPAESEIFMTETATGGISLESAKHLLIAFSRVRNKYEPSNKNNSYKGKIDSEGLSDAQS